MPRALKDFDDAETFGDTRSPRWAADDLALLGALVASAIGAIAAFAYVALRVLH